VCCQPDGRAGGIRTHGLCVPNAALYQAKLQPDVPTNEAFTTIFKSAFFALVTRQIARTSNARNPQKKTSDWKKIGKCLRYKGGDYYALLKRSGKQIRHCLETSNLALARRKLKDFTEDPDNSPYKQMLE